MTPKRIQRKRTAGWRMPEGAVYVGRPSQWGNPFRDVSTVGWPDQANAAEVAMFRAFIADVASVPDGQAVYLTPLRGHDLACWCPLDQPCHADVLLELANACPQCQHPETEHHEPSWNEGFWWCNRCTQEAAATGDDPRSVGPCR